MIWKSAFIPIFLFISVQKLTKLYVDELVQTGTEVSRAMYLTCSSLLHHFIVCSTCSG